MPRLPIEPARDLHNPFISIACARRQARYPPVMAPVRPGPVESRKGNLLVSLKQLIRTLLLDRQSFWHLTALLFLGEAALGLLIIWKVPCPFPSSPLSCSR